MTELGGPEQTGTWLTVLASVAVVTLMVFRSGFKGITAFIAVYFLFFAFGPVINYLVGNKIYFGTTLSSIPNAALGMSIALLGMFVSTILVPQRTHFDQQRLLISGRTYPAVSLLHAGLSLYSVGIIFSLGSRIGADKITKISAVGPYHYKYLLIAALASAFFFTSGSSKLGRYMLCSHLLTYTLYCLATNERDFIFVYFSLLLHWRLFRRWVSLLPMALAGVALFGLATYLFAERSGGSADTEQALNQGSLLFVDSYIAHRYPATTPFSWGGTYVDSIIGLMPGWLVDARPSLADQLVQSYAPGSAGGYGFSLTSEAYMNFGLVGIAAAFLLLALCQQALVDRCDKSLFWTYSSIAFSIAWMYAVRGESSMFINWVAAALVIYGFVALLSLRPGMPVAGRRRPPTSATRIEAVSGSASEMLDGTGSHQNLVTPAPSRTGRLDTAAHWSA